MKIKDAYYVGTHPYNYRCGEPAKIIGMAMVTPEGLPERPCYVVMWDDGIVDYKPIHVPEGYIITGNKKQKRY